MAAFSDTDQKGKKWEDYKRIKCPNGEIIDMEKLLDEQDWAKAALSKKVPYWGKFIGDMKFVYTFRVETQATDGLNIYVNPQFTFHLSPQQKVFVMAHEIMHCLLNHLRRSESSPYSSDPNKANIAADYECNDTLVDMEVTTEAIIDQTHGYFDKKYFNMPFEVIFDKISQHSPGSMASNPSQNMNQGSGQQGQGGGQQGQGQRSGQNNQNQKSKAQADAYKKGWEIAKKLHKAGKLNI